MSLPRIGVLAVREDTRRLRRMLASGRARIVAATVSQRSGRWTVSLTVAAADLHPGRQHRPQPSDEGEHRSGEHASGQCLGGGWGPVAGRWVGVDRGLSAFVVAANADGAQLLRVDDPPRPLRAAKARLRRLGRQVSRKQRGSGNRRRAVAQLGRAHARIRNVRQHFLHQVANTLVKTHDQIAVQDLHIAGMLANHRLAAAISDAAWGQLVRLIGYKQAWRGGHLALVDRWYPSTKTCAACHTVTAAAVPLSMRVFTCPRCGHQADRDLNAATNLAI